VLWIFKGSVPLLFSDGASLPLSYGLSPSYVAFYVL
jgi:hypothetical protein